MYIEMVKNYINSINNGGIPNISNAWEVIIENECIDAYKKVLIFIIGYKSI
jgi:hypothetical protein